MAAVRNDPLARRKRARFRAAHRGTKEMDVLLGRFAEAEVDKMEDAELNAFEEFLALPDPDIENWLLARGRHAPEGQLGEFVARLKRFHGI